MNKKLKKEREEAYESLPPVIKESLTTEEKEMFLTAEQWPDTLFNKLAELAHRIKGTAGTVGFPQFTAVAEHLEVAAVSADAATCETRILTPGDEITIP